MGNGPDETVPWLIAEGGGGRGRPTTGTRHRHLIPPDMDVSFAANRKNSLFGSLPRGQKLNA